MSLSPTTSRFSRLAVEESILGYKTSAAFLSSLSTNLRLDTSSPLPSPVSTPILAAHNGLGIPSPLSRTILAAASAGLKLSIPNAPVSFTNSRASPECSPTSSPTAAPTQHRRKRSGCTFSLQSQLPYPYTASTANDPTTREAALDLITFSVTSQRRSALYTLCTHPLNASGFVLLLYTATRCLRAFTGQDTSHAYPWLQNISLWLLVSLLAFAALLIAVWRPYIRLTRDLDHEWLDSDTVILIHKPPDPATHANTSTIAHPSEKHMTETITTNDEPAQLVAALVLTWQIRESQISKCRRKRIGRGFIRAWAVNPQDRHLGLGTALLRKAAHVHDSRGGEGLWFAEDHAHSARVLPSMYNGVFDRRDRLAQGRLDAVLKEQGACCRKR